MSYYNEAIMKHIMVHVNEEGDAYKKFFSAALKKYGVKSPHELDDEKKRSFFNYIEKNYKAKDEVVEAKLNEREPVAKEKDMIKKLDNAYSFFLKFSKEIRDATKNVTQADYKEIERGMSFVSRDARRQMDRLEKAIKKAKKLNILEACFPLLSEQQELMDKDPEKFEVMKQFVDKAFKKAGIKVKKTKIMKRGFTRSVFGMFYYVKAASGNDVLPVYIDKKGMMELGVSSWGFKLGKIDQFNKIVANLKDFKKSDLDESISEGKLRSRIKKAILIAIEMSGNMTGAVDKIEKIKKGLSNDNKVAAALKMANEGKNKGLWHNIHAKRKRGESPAKPGDDDYPETLDIESKLKQEVGSPLNSYVSHALQDMKHLLDVAQDKEFGPDAFSSVKKSAKLLIAAIKLLRKVK